MIITTQFYALQEQTLDINVLLPCFEHNCYMHVTSLYVKTKYNIPTLTLNGQNTINLSIS